MDLRENVVHNIFIWIWNFYQLNENLLVLWQIDIEEILFYKFILTCFMYIEKVEFSCIINSLHAHIIKNH